MLYDYECQECNYYFEATQSIHEEPLLRCPKCDKHSLVRIITGGLYASVRKGKDEITLGHLADRNRSEFSDDKKEMLDAKSDMDRFKAPPTPEGWFGDPKVNTSNMSKEQKKKYIETGKVS